MQSRTQPKPLAALAPGEEGTVLEIRGGHGITNRLFSMGIAPGKKIRLIKTSGGGPALVAIGDTRLAIGKGQLFHIIVE